MNSRCDNCGAEDCSRCHKEAEKRRKKSGYEGEEYAVQD